MNQWEITDNEGVIYSGTEEEMQEVFEKITSGEYSMPWKGDLKLVEVHNLYK